MSNEQPSFDWRQYLPVHHAADAFPKLPHAELVALGNDIRANGLRLPIVVHAEGDPDNPEFKLIDGRSRLDAMAAVGIEFKFERGICARHNQTGLRLNIISDIPLDASGGNVQMAPGSFSEDGIGDLVRSLNLHRRHLDAKGKLDAIDALLKLDPGKSDRQIADQTKSSPTTVGKRRKKGEAAGDVSIVDTRTDARGRKQPAKKSKPSARAATDAATVEHDRQACIALDQKVRAAERESAQWRADHPVEDDAAASAERRKAANAKDTALHEFDAHALRLVQMTKNAKPGRFTQTGVPADVLAHLGDFLRDVAAELRSDVDAPRAPAPSQTVGAGHG